VPAIFKQPSVLERELPVVQFYHTLSPGILTSFVFWKVVFHISKM